MATRTSNNKIKIGVHWKNSVAIGLPSPGSPRHPKLIELDSVCTSKTTFLEFISLFIECSTG